MSVDRAESSGARATAVQSIDRWLKVSRQDGRLGSASRMFCEDIRAGRNLQKWARSNVDQMLPYRSQSPRLLLIVRAGALFLPILLTWLALSQVIGPFSLFLQNQQPSANFLWFWQTNPGGSFASPWKLGHVALTDAAILAFLTVLAMRISWWEAGRTETNEHAYSDMLAAVENYLAEFR